MPCASPASPHPSIKESTKGGRRPKAAAPFCGDSRRRRPPPFWMGVGRLVRHRESLRGHFMRTFQQRRGNIVRSRCNFLATSSQAFWPWDTTGQKSTKNRQNSGNLFGIIGPQTGSIHALIPIIGCGIFRRFLVKWSQGPYGPPENQKSKKQGRF